MSPEREERVRESWAAMAPHADAVAAAFYRRLFETDPHARQLFAATDMGLQRQKFMAMLAEIVRVLDDPGLLVSELAASGRRHVQYGVADRDYASVGAALLWALREELGESFDPETEEAWRELYGLVSAVMRRAGGRVAAPRR